MKRSKANRRGPLSSGGFTFWMNAPSSLNVYLLASIIAGVSFGILGVIFLVTTLDANRLAQASQAWPSTVGTVVEAWVNESIERNDEGETSRYFAPVIVYAYNVDGHTYHAERLHFGFTGRSTDRRPAERMVAQYPAGMQLTVYYDPAAPVDAVLDREVQGGWIGYSIGGVSLLFSILLLGFALRKGLGLGRQTSSA